jgi:mono/diheme cytochrome c family protein
MAGITRRAFLKGSPAPACLLRMHALRCPWLPTLFAGCWMLLVALSAVPAADNRPPANPAEFFERSVRPMLATHCFECHGPQKQRGGLRLDSRTALLAGGDTGPALIQLT